jgi:phage tail sheath protein FI
MPLTYTYPGVYIEEVPSGVRTIAGVSTSNTAFVDFFKRGPVDRAVRVTSREDFERRFGGLDPRSEASYAIYQYYLNGGSIAWVVRVVSTTATAAELGVQSSSDYSYVGSGSGGAALKIAAANPGDWGNNLQVGIDYNGTARNSAGQPEAFNLVVREVVGQVVINFEVYRNLSNNDTTSARYVESVINQISSLIRVESESIGLLPQKTGEDVIASAGAGENTADFLSLGRSPNQAGSDGGAPGGDDWADSPNKAAAILAGKNHLERIAPEVFNLLCLPAAFKLANDDYNLLVSEATKFCRDHRAFYIVDVPQGVTFDGLNDWMKDHDTLRSDYSALYFPPVTIADPLNENRPREVGPSGTMAGVYARTDAVRGIWKAPAGTEATLAGAKLQVKLTDLENGGLNPIGINVLRNFPIFGNICWGARTLDGADQKSSEWKYIPVRRTALFIEESLYQGLKWVVFEPNDEPLWAQIRLNVGAFMNGLFRQGAFQGRTTRESYLVKCDKDTTTQNDIDRGIVNILVGFAPLKPAEFVVIRIQQIAGQLAV